MKQMWSGVCLQMAVVSCQCEADVVWCLSADDSSQLSV